MGPLIELAGYEVKGRILKAGVRVKCRPRYSPAFHGVVRRVMISPHDEDHVEVEVTYDHTNRSGQCGFRTLRVEYVTSI